MPTFLYPWLAIAGAAAASVPVIVHLLNRRRFKVVQWAAMDFLREAVARSRRAVEFRDLLLLLMRVACLLIFALALGRPYWNRTSKGAADPSQPIHAIMLIDNSLSMSYQKFDGTMLDEAKAKAREVIDGLPRGSVISVLPTCGSAEAVGFEVHARPEEALEALQSIKPVDRAALPGPVLSLAAEACRRTTSMAASRIFLVTDQQVEGWSAEAEREQLKQLPCPLQVVKVSAGEVDNAWISEVQLRDGVADAESPAVFVTKIGYQGTAPRANVQVTLKVDNAVFSAQTVELQPGQTREVQFPEYHFPTPAEKGKTSYSTVEVSIPHDRLPGDDQRSLVVPVTASLPVVFVDSEGSDEEPSKGQYGDTYWLRRLLAPHINSSEQEQPLIQIRQLKMDQLDREVLADARLVVIAGVAAPTPAAVTLLRQYIEQGGNVLIAAGGDFDPAQWTEIAWKDGLGILPAPLDREMVGAAREDLTSQAIPFVMNIGSLVHQYYWPEGVSEEDLRALLGPPTFFFKAVVPQVGDRVQTQASKAAEDYFTKQRKRLAEIDSQLAQLDSASNSGGTPAQKSREELQKEHEEIQPSWLTWRKNSAQEDGEQLSLDDVPRAARPVVLGRYSNDVPMLVRRQWGRGRVLLLSTSLSPHWTTMPEVGQSWWLMDRIVRSLLTDTLPSWNFSSEGSFVLPVAIGERTARYMVTDPEGQQQVLSVDALGGDRFGVAMGNWTRRGIYRVTASRSGEAGEAEAGRLWEIPLAVNGPADESILTIERDNSQSGQRTLVDIAAEPPAVAPFTVAGIDFWKLLIALAIALLLAELLLAVKSTARPEPAR